MPGKIISQRKAGQIPYEIDQQDPKSHEKQLTLVLVCLEKWKRPWLIPPLPLPRIGAATESASSVPRFKWGRDTKRSLTRPVPWFLPKILGSPLSTQAQEFSKNFAQTSCGQLGPSRPFQMLLCCTALITTPRMLNRKTEGISRTIFRNLETTFGRKSPPKPESRSPVS